MKKLDRKQIQQVVVLSILFVAALGYAGYQLFFTGPTGASTKSSTSTEARGESSQAEEQPTTVEPPWLTSTGPARDPFAIPPQFDNLRRTQAASVRPSPPRVASAPNIGTLPPMPVVPVSGNAGSVPAPTNSHATSEPQPESLPQVTVTGVVVGARPVAILRSEGGNQRIVQPGHQLEGGYVLREVSREGIVLDKDGKTVTLRPGGSPNAK